MSATAHNDLTGCTELEADHGVRREAVAMTYNPGQTAPRIVAKGYGNIADAIIRCAAENALYVHESPELVGLLMQLEVDMQIPPALYVAVAELLGWLYNLESDGVETYLTTSNP
jgi:flagellar biosynthesis protein